MRHQDGRETFRAAGRPYAMVGAMTGFFVGLGALATWENAGAWPVLAIAAGAGLYLVIKLLYLRLEITGDGVRYRTLRADRTWGFADLERGYFQTVVNRAAPQGVRSFWLKPRAGPAINIDLQTLPVRAATVLFGALQRHGIPIDVPESPAPERNRPTRLL